MIERYSRPAMREIWSTESKLKLWLEVEILALEAMVDLELAPQSALANVKKKAAFSVERTLEIEREVKHDVIAFLTNVAENVGEDSRYIHLGMTSSDLLDTCFALQLTRSADLIIEGIDTLLDNLKTKAFEFKDTPCIGRSHGIHAEPTTFGLKIAGWYAELQRQRMRVISAREDIAVGAISGPVGTFAHLSPSVEVHVCKKLGLKPASVSTQIISRDSHAAFFLTLAQVAASLERIVVEVRHLQRTEVREAEEYFSLGQKGSSAMPHKKNPILSENICGLARLIRGWAGTSLENIPLWHERDMSHSSVERVIAPDISLTLDFMLARVTSIVKGLMVYPKNMEKNLNLTGGLIYSGTMLVLLAEKGISREDAYSMVQRHALATWAALNENAENAVDFPSRVRQDKEITKLLSKKEVDEVFSLKRHLKHVDMIFKRVFT